jgi:hypothetical protein
MKTNCKEVKTVIQKYVIDCIDTSDYPEIKTDLKNQLSFIVDEFHRVAMYSNNIHRFKGNYQQLFIDWLSGLPSYFNVEYRNYEILELMSSFGLPLPANKEESQGIDLFYYLVYREFLTLLKKNNLTIYR